MEPIADEKAYPGHGLGGSSEGSSGDGVLLRRRVASAAGLLQRWNLWKVEGESLMECGGARDRAIAHQGSGSMVRAAAAVFWPTRRTTERRLCPAAFRLRRRVK
uniref:Uncharacterized protein n=1 Tax=Oryza glumipatula TaxID=40148 RepID=A0A0E0BHU3_9ORYZ